jgi:RNA polymerase sigma-70 factor (ECF subfamily)
MDREPVSAVTLHLEGGSMHRPEREVEVVVREIYEAHYGLLAGWAARLVGDTELGHDLATEAFVRLLRDPAAVQEPKAWLYTVTAHLVQDHWRKRGHERSAYRRFETAADRTGSEPDAATRLTLQEVVLSLPDGLRLPVLLHYYADLPVAVVAARLGKSEGAVKRNLFDARRRMAAQLEGAR